jgi:hypothetical protein
VGRRLDGRIGVLEGLRSRLRALLLSSAAVQCTSAEKGGLNRSSHHSSSSSSSSSINNSSTSRESQFLRTSTDLTHMVSKMKPLFTGKPTQRTQSDKDKDKDKGKDKRALFDSCAAVREGRMSHGLFMDSSSSSSGSGSRCSRASCVLFDVSVSDASYTPLETEGGAAVLVSVLVQNTSL